MYTGEAARLFFRVYRKSWKLYRVLPLPSISPSSSAVSFLPALFSQQRSSICSSSQSLSFTPSRENHPRAVNPLIYSRRFLEFCQPRPQSALVLFTLLVHRRRSSPSTLSHSLPIFPLSSSPLSRVSSTLLSKSKLTSSCSSLFSFLLRLDRRPIVHFLTVSPTYSVALSSGALHNITVPIRRPLGES